MTTEVAIEMSRQCVLLAFLVSLPVMAAALLVGLLVSLGQAVTQLQDQTLSFVPKLLAMTVVLLWTLPWTLSVLMDYAEGIFRNIVIGP